MASQNPRGAPVPEAAHLAPARAHSEGLPQMRSPGSVWGSGKPRAPPFPGRAPAEGGLFSECEFHLLWNVPVAAEGKEAGPQAALALTARPPQGGRAADGWQACHHPACPCLCAVASGRDVCLPPARPPHAGCRGLLAWRENTGPCGRQTRRCLSRDWGASLEGTRRPHILPPPSIFPKQPGLGWAWLPGVAEGQEPGTGQGKEALAGASRVRRPGEGRQRSGRAGLLSFDVPWREGERKSDCVCVGG